MTYSEILLKASDTSPLLEPYTDDDGPQILRGGHGFIIRLHDAIYSIRLVLSERPAFGSEIHFRRDLRPYIYGMKHNKLVRTTLGLLNSFFVENLSILRAVLKQTISWSGNKWC